jgi:hypothetical protein
MDGWKKGMHEVEGRKEGGDSGGGDGTIVVLMW